MISEESSFPEGRIFSKITNTDNVTNPHIREKNFQQDGETGKSEWLYNRNCILASEYLGIFKESSYFEKRILGRWRDEGITNTHTDDVKNPHI